MNVPYAEQVQRLMKIALKESRRAMRHTITLPPSYWALEPNDTVAYTSVRHGYSAKLFRVDAVLDRIDAHVTLDITELQSTDYDWTTGADFTAMTARAPVASPPAAQSVPSFAAAGYTINGGAANQAPAIKLTWDATQIDDVQAVRWQGRIPSIGTAIVFNGQLVNPEDGEAYVSEGILPNTAYEVRAKLVANRKTTWTSWASVTTPNVSAPATSGTVTNSQLANMAQATFKMRAAGAGTGNPIDGTAAQAKTALAIAQSDVTNLVTDLAAKAPLASPVFTGDPTGPTPSFGDNDTSLATTAFVQGLVAYAQLTADYTLTSTTTAQKLFGTNISTNGALTLATGRYAFRLLLYMTGMSTAAADNLKFRIDSGGSASLANFFYFVSGIDAANGLAVGTLTGSASITNPSEVNIVVGTTNGELSALIEGTFNVTGAGTIIPSVALTTAAAAIVKANSLMVVQYLGPTGSNAKGAWS
jgi:hypothetical protein